MNLPRLRLRARLDIPLSLSLTALCAGGLFVLYSATGQDLRIVVGQFIRALIGLLAMAAIAQFSPHHLRRWSPLIYAFGLILLVTVIFFGAQAKGAQRWLEFAGLFRFQPAELMKLALPLMLARLLSMSFLPPSLSRLGLCVALIAIPFVLILQQPDLGTSLMLLISGLFVVFLAGMQWRYWLGLAAAAVASLPALWHFALHDYQRRRIATLLDPESDPLNAGWHTIQAKIAIGSGGAYGKGWLNGTQSQLEFLPERHTDFIFAVIGEEFGFGGLVVLIALYLVITGRGLYIAANTQDTFSRLLAGGISLTFFAYVFVNIGMVSGILPVVGLPLPLVSYGGSSMVTLLIGFGMIMSVHTHKNLFRHGDSV